MEKLQRLARSLKSARSYDLPEDPTNAYYMLLSYVMQNQHKVLIDLLGPNTKFDVNHVCGRSLRTLLHMAANTGAYECLCHLLKIGAKTNICDRQGITPLQVAARNGWVRCITKLLEHGADIETKNNEGMTAIHWLASNGRTEVFTEILKYIKDVDLKDDNQQTPLHVACLNGHKMTVLKLLELNADIEMENIWGCTPIYFACRHGHAEVVTLLLRHGATLKCNRDGESPIDAALKGGYSRVCFALAEWDPKILQSVLQSCQKEDIELEKVNIVLSYLMSQDISFRNYILLVISKAVHNEGIKLLSQSSVYKTSCKVFLKNVNILNFLLTLNPRKDLPSNLNEDFRLRTDSARFRFDSARSRLDSTRSRTENTRTADLLNQYEVEPENISEIKAELTSLWDILESWMRVLQNEVNTMFSKSKDSDKPLVKNMEKGTLSLFKMEALCLSCQISSQSTNVSRRQASRNSRSFERLRLSQPALQFSLVEDPASLVNENLEIHLANVFGVSPSESPSSDDGEPIMNNDSSEHVVSNQPLISGETQHSLNEDQALGVNGVIETYNDVISTVPSTSSQNDNESENMQILSPKNPPGGTGDDISGLEMIDMAGDRLCALIHGFFLNSQCQSIWENLKGKVSNFNKFIKRYEDVLHLLVSRKPQLIFEHFSFILENPLMLQQFLPAIHSQPLSERQKWFYERLYAGKNDASLVDEESVINVARASLLEMSCKILSDRNQENLKSNIAVRFEGEEGMGAGVTREWFDLLVKEILNPDCALFTLSADGSTFQPNSNSAINPDHLSYFQFAGRILGLALYHKHLITAYFTRSFYKHILGVPVSYTDVDSIDPEYSKNLQWILDNSIDKLGLDITFAVETDVFGQTQEVELKPNGKNILVTDRNKFEYVHLAADLRMTKAIKQQMFAFLKGFYNFIPHSLASFFNEYELELMLSGVPYIDLEDWKKNTTYQAGFTEESPTIQWFWEAVSNFTKEEKIQLLQFVTGTSRVPWGGFCNLSGPDGSLFTICRVEGTSEMLPTASTCFNMMKMPEYTSKEELIQKVKMAVTCGCHGFQFT